MAHQGSVKWFDPVRGFGFVVSEELERDVLLHANVLRAFGQSSVADGSLITFRHQAGDRGLQVTEILSLTAPETGPDSPEYLREIPDDLPYQPARVKWFDKGKGFGFANVFGQEDDVFVHIEVLRRFGLADLQMGEAICIRVMDGARGRLAVEVRRWEFFIA
ncbi:cold-shock protein [uncultured Jannaschia sp.]|uniref:cold-shock protein n=1 Tax=uncultured Jannaschia sp. TaxID=293347 RepID=UPI002623B556|nr:cold shock domain-containing protein [uncultured Jannaschia sp.]